MRIATLAAAMLAVATLAACSSSGGSGTAPPAGSLPAGSLPASKVAASGPPAAGSVIDPCTKLTTAQAQPLQSDRITGAKASTQPLYTTTDLHVCAFHTANSSDAITVSVFVGPKAQTTYDQFRQSEDKPTDVPGVGDKAYRGDESAGLTSIHGDVLCEADVEDAGTVPGADRLYTENGHHTDIGAPAFDVIAKALGTLCNRVYGSGSTTPDLSGLAALHPPASSS